MLELKKTSRGFAWSQFKDNFYVDCSIQKSSLATEDCIWLGVEREDSKGRMHLTREMVAELLPLLQRFVETGEIAEPA